MNLLLIDLYFVLINLLSNSEAFHFYNYYSNYTHIHNVLIIVCLIYSRYLTYLPTNSHHETNIAMTIFVSNAMYLF